MILENLYCNSCSGNISMIIIIIIATLLTPWGIGVGTKRHSDSGQELGELGVTDNCPYER